MQSVTQKSHKINSITVLAATTVRLRGNACDNMIPFGHCPLHGTQVPLTSVFFVPQSRTHAGPSISTCSGVK